MLVAAMLVGAATADDFDDIDMKAARVCAQKNPADCGSECVLIGGVGGVADSCASFTANATAPAWSYTAYKDGVSGGPLNATEVMAQMTGSGPPKDGCGDNVTGAYWVMADPINGGPYRFDDAKEYTKEFEANLVELNSRIVLGDYGPKNNAGYYIIDGFKGLGVVCTYTAGTTVGRYGNSTTHPTMEMMPFNTLRMFPSPRDYVTTNAAAARQRRQAPVAGPKTMLVTLNTPPTAPLTGNEIVHVAVKDDADGAVILSGIARNGNRLKIGDVEVAVDMAETFIMSETNVGRAIQTASGAYMRPTVASCPCAYNIVKKVGNQATCTSCPPGQINGGNNTCVDPASLKGEANCAADKNETNTFAEIGIADAVAGKQPTCEPEPTCVKRRSCGLETLGMFSTLADVRTGSPSCSEDYWVLHFDGADLRFKRGDNGDCGDENGVSALDAVFEDGKGAYLTRNVMIQGTSSLNHKCATMKNLVDDDGNDLGLGEVDYVLPEGSYNESRATGPHLPAPFEASAKAFVTNMAEYIDEVDKPQKTDTPARARRNDPHLKRLRLTSSEKILFSMDGVEDTVQIDTWFAPPWRGTNPTDAVCALVVSVGDEPENVRIMMNEYFPNLIKCSTATGWSGHVKLVHSGDVAHDGHHSWMETYWIGVAAAISAIVVVVGLVLGVKKWRKGKLLEGSMAVPFL